jgi:predicted RNA-binding Zn ribbon-like protein
VIQPGGRAQAPGTLEIVQAFANTKDLLTGRDVFTSSEMLRGWLATRGLLRRDEPISEEDFQRALVFREALRSLVRANTGSRIDEDVLEVLNQAAKYARLVTRFSQNGQIALEPEAGGLDGVVGRLLANVFIAMTEGTWARLKSCQNEECQWIYYDVSKNRSGTWCTMAMCGNRLKAQAYRQRRKVRDA